MITIQLTEKKHQRNNFSVQLIKNLHHLLLLYLVYMYEHQSERRALLNFQKSKII